MANVSYSSCFLTSPSCFSIVRHIMETQQNVTSFVENSLCPLPPSSECVHNLSVKIVMSCNLSTQSIIIFVHCADDDKNVVKFRLGNESGNGCSSRFVS